MNCQICDTLSSENKFSCIGENLAKNLNVLVAKFFFFFDDKEIVFHLCVCQMEIFQTLGIAFRVSPSNDA